MQNIKKYQFLLLSILLIAAISVRIYYIQGKDCLFLDENLSIILSNYTTLGWTETLPQTDDEPYTGNEIVSLFFSDINTAENVLMDIWALRKSTRDVHPNLYYSMLRISFWGSDTSNLSHVLMRGLGLNLLLFMIGFIFFAKIIRLFTHNLAIIGSVIFIAFFNPIAVGNSIFLRQYQLQETLFIILAYLFVCLYLYLQKRTSSPERHNTQLMTFTFSAAFISALTVLSGYFSTVLLVLLWTAVLFFILNHKKNKIQHLSLFAAGALASLLFIYIIYPTALTSILNNRGNVSIDIFSDAFLQKIKLLWTLVIANYTGHTATILLILIGSYTFFSRARKQSCQTHVPILVLTFSALFWMLFTWIIAPFDVLRYIAPGIPVLSLALLIVFNNIPNLKLKVISMISVCVLVSINLFTSKHIYWDKPDLTHYQPNVPLIMYNKTNPWGQTAMIPFIQNNDTVEIAYNRETLLRKIEKYNEMYIVIHNSYSHLEEIPKDEYDIEYAPVFESSIWFKGYKVKRK